MSNNKQTAVEWFIEQLEGDDSKIARVIGLKKYNSLIQQAKEMQKQQIESAYYTGATNFSEHSTKAVRWSKQYYNEEYGNHQNENPKCVFESSNTNSSVTICKWCGKEKWQHNEEYGKL